MQIPPIPWSGVGMAFLVTLLLLWVGMPIACRLGWVDRPGLRKCHTTEPPP